MSGQRQLRAQFCRETDLIEDGVFVNIQEPVKVLVYIVEHPDGGIETITCTNQIQRKIDDLNARYDYKFRHQSNPGIKVIGYILA